MKKILSILIALCVATSMFAKEGDVLAQVQGTGAAYGRQTTTDSKNVGWVTIGQSGYFGINSAANNTGKKGGVNATDLPVAKAVDPSATSSTSTTSNSCTGYYTFYTTTSITNAGSIEFYYSANSGNSNATAYVVMGDVKSASGGAAYDTIPLHASSTSKQGVNLGTSGTFTFKFANTQTGAKFYGVVIKTSSYKRMTGGKITIYEGATASCTAPTITTQPVGATYTQGASATALSIVASGSSVTYQWYKNTTNSTAGATSISGATSSSYTPSTAATGTTYYYCVASSSTCTTTSNIVAVTVNAPSYTVTPRSNNESLGTVSGSTTITASPKSCVGYASPAYIVTGGSATVNQDGNTFTVSGMTANVTVTINFAEQAHDTYIDNVQSTSMDGNYCGSYTAPVIADKSQATSGTCEQVHYHFVGWVSAANKSNPTDVNIVKAGTAMTANETTYYAVWAKEE